MTRPLLADKVAVVTGAGQGIGREIARTLHCHGAQVTLADLDGSAARDAGSETYKIVVSHQPAVRQ
ncbi:hypothetical protein AWC19_24315 [Mycobacterium palustre]|uniref:Short-chain dehydrogenase n=1 Tax=Mycobacterium palustre TaxID=153971 RepID=A0A1X2A003_9MYCO|nr:hypothetical protein AWC19_24315 [Mycobacterium palustre]